MAKGKPSFKATAEEILKKPIWDVFESMTDVKTVEAAQSRLVALSGGKLITTTATIIRTISNGLELGEIQGTPHYLSWIPEPKEAGKRGKQSMQDLIEHLTGQSLWDLFREKFADVETAEEASKRLTQLSKDKVSCTGGTVINTILRGVESKAITQDEPFFKWCPVPKEKAAKKVVAETGETVEVKKAVNAIAVEFSCECGARFKKNSDIISSNYNLGLKAIKCPSCSRWNSLTADLVINGETYRKAVKDRHGLNNVLIQSEEFIDKKGHILPNPFGQK